MAYILAPPLNKAMDSTLRSFIYLSLIVFGAVQAVYQPLVVSHFLPEPIVRSSGGFVAILSVLALVATIKRNLRLEYGTIWFLTGGFFIYVLSMWLVTAQEGSGYLKISLVGTATLMLLVHRAFRLGVIAKTAYALRRKELNTLSKLWRK